MHTQHFQEKTAATSPIRSGGPLSRTILVLGLAAAAALTTGCQTTPVMTERTAAARARSIQAAMDSEEKERRAQRLEVFYSSPTTVECAKIQRVVARQRAEKALAEQMEAERSGRTARRPSRQRQEESAEEQDFHFVGGAPSASRRSSQGTIVVYQQEQPADPTPDLEPLPADIKAAEQAPGIPGVVISPYDNDKRYVDVRGYSPGATVRDPWTGRAFQVP